MTVSELHTAFKIKLDKSNSLSYPDFADEEIDFWLNEAQIRFVKTRYSGNNYKGTSFEETEKRTNDLRNVVGEALLPSTGTSAINTNSYWYDVPDGYWFSLLEEINVTYDDCNGDEVSDRIEVKAIDLGKYSKYIKDPFNKPNKKRALRLMQYNKITIITDADTTAGYLYLRYVKEPDVVSLSGGVTISLSNHTHDEIVDLAVVLALENIESPRMQTSSALNIQNE
jgi:hypothetical protein